MKPSRTAATVVLAAFLSSSLPHVAWAQQDDPVTTQARARFKEGVDFYDKGQYENARLAFLQAYALKKHPAVLLNLAQSSAKAGHPLEASKYFQQFLKESTGASPAQRTDAESGLAEVRQKLGRIEIVAPAGTDITLDEKDRLGTAPFAEPIDVEPGGHSLRAANETVRVQATAGQKVQAKFGGPVGPAVTPVPVGPPPADTTPPPPPSPPPPSGERKEPLPMWPAYVGAGVAGVTLVTTIIFAISKSSAQDKANTVAANIRSAAGDRATGICTSTAQADIKRFGDACGTLKDDNDKVNTDATLANVSGALFGVSAVFTAAWFIAVPMVNKNREQGSPPPATSFFKDVSVTPYAGLGNGGLTLRGGF